MNRIAALLALAALPLSAQAQFFVEGTLGGVRADLGEFRDRGFATDEADGTWSLGGGYMFNRHLGIEAGYRALGESVIRTAGGASATFGGQAFAASGGAVASAEVQGIYLGPVFETFIDRFRLHARAGMYLWEAEVRAVGAATYAGLPIPPGGALEDKQDGIDPYVGLGVSYAVTDRTFLGLSWTGFRVLDDIRFHAWDVRLKFSF